MSETASRLTPRSEFSEADVGAPTPTRFLLECGEYKLTPNLSTLSEVNPFEASFTSPSGKKEITVSTCETNNTSIPTDNTILATTSTFLLSSNRVSKNVLESALEEQRFNAGTLLPATIQAIFETSQKSNPAPKTSKEVVINDLDSGSDNRQNGSYKKSGSYKRRESDNPDNDKEKRRRFLERNRVAASKCRQKKKMWVKELEQKSEEITIRNKELQQLVGQLKEELLQLKNQLLGHRNCHCNAIQQYVQTSGRFSQLSADVNGVRAHLAGVSMAISVPQGNFLSSQPSFPTVPPLSTMTSWPPSVNN